MSELKTEPKSDNTIIYLMLVINILASIAAFFYINEIREKLDVVTPIVVVDPNMIAPKNGANANEYQKKLTEVVNDYEKRGFIVLKSGAVYATPSDVVIEVKVE